MWEVNCTGVAALLLTLAFKVKVDYEFMETRSRKHIPNRPYWAYGYSPITVLDMALSRVHRY